MGARIPASTFEGTHTLATHQQSGRTNRARALDSGSAPGPVDLSIRLVIQSNEDLVFMFLSIALFVLQSQ